VPGVPFDGVYDDVNARGRIDVAGVAWPFNNP